MTDSRWKKQTNKQKGEGSSITVYTSHPAGTHLTHTQLLSGFR